MTCGKKHGFIEEKDAINALNYGKKKAGKKSIPKSYYRCPDCNLFHLTSMKKTDLKKLKRIGRIR